MICSRYAFSMIINDFLSSTFAETIENKYGFMWRLDHTLIFLLHKSQLGLRLVNWLITTSALILYNF